jgi:beta-galactosidase
MYFGADYYPEHWPREWWETHAKLMREANLNVVRLAEFAWAKLEPEEGTYDFTWLDEAMEVLAKEGVQVVMGTPTATPPKWLMDKHSDIYMKDAYVRVRGFGSRRHYCHNNPVFLKESKRIAAKMAEHYAGNPNVVAWQIDNEFGCHDTTNCYCEHCLDAFKVWLQRKYGTVDTLNSEWGTVFWSQTYRTWDELILPAYTATENLNHRNFSHNPGMLLDFQRFSSDSVVAYQKLQVEEIRKSCSLPITHNLMGHFSDLDYYNLGMDLDFVSWDNYIQSPWGNTSYTGVAMAHDLMRGIRNQNFWVMELQSGPCGWDVLGDTPKPGQIRLWTYQSIAHGAEGIVYFRWRACTFGTEEYWYGILDHDGIPRRRYFEIQQTGRELQALSDLIVDSRVVTEAALIKSYDNVWSHRFQKHAPQFDYNKLLGEYYTALAANSISIDITSENNDLSQYKIVFMPAFNLMTEELKTRLETYVQNGGTLVTSFRSGTRNWNNSMTTETLPGYFKNLAGIEVEEFDALNFGRKVKVTGSVGESNAVIWCDVINPENAQVLATYADEYYKGKAAVTVNQFGKGLVYYVGCDLEPAAMKELVKTIAERAAVKPVFTNLPEGVEAVLKEKAGKQYIMVMNHNSSEAALKLPSSYQELISGKSVQGQLELEPYGVAVLA